MVAIGTHAGVRTEAVLTSMEAPLGMAVGNALEIAECVATLEGRGPARLTKVVSGLGARMVMLAGLETSAEAAAARVGQALDSGRALETFARMVRAQGGDAAVIEQSDRLPSAPDRDLVRAVRSGYVTAIRAEGIGRASAVLGAGRERAGEPVDHAVGVVLEVQTGDRVDQGQPLVTLHHRGGHGLPLSRRYCEESLVVGDTPPPPVPDILEYIAEGGSS
jgi:thymidine phosphorylase